MEIPNESRYISKGILDEIVYYPLDDIYYYKNELIKLPFRRFNKEILSEEKFNKLLTSQRIEYAIKFLQITSLKKYIIKNYKDEYLDIFYYLSELKYPIEENIDAFREIVNILVENFEDYSKSIFTLRDIIPYDNILSVLPIDENNICYICLMSEPKYSLINICSCKTPIHSSCLLELNKHKPLNKCAVCLTSYKINESVYRAIGLVSNIKDPAIFFPYNDFYYEPLLCRSEPIKYTGMERLTMAIMYLQVDRVSQLLKEPEILNNLDRYYFETSYKQTPIVALSIGNMQSNCNIIYGDNRMKYINIIRLLVATKKIAIHAIDIFGKNYKDYIKNNKLNFLIKPIEGQRYSVDELVDIIQS